MISQDNAYSLIQKSGNLPTLPAILLKLLAACDNDDTSLSEISAIISKDPVLSIKVLQLVNSAYYGFRYSFRGIEQAVIYLGKNTIKNVALTMSVHQVFDRGVLKNVRKFNIHVFWYQSLMCATLAKRIAQKIGFADIEEAYLSGLLHDIGKLILISTFPKEYGTILVETAGPDSTLSAETQLLGVTHCETGSWLMEQWQLSPTMADAIRYHHEPMERIKEAFPLVKIIYVANLLNDNIDNLPGMHQIDGLLTGLNHGDVQEIVEGAAEEVEQVADHLDIIVQKPSETNIFLAKPVAAKKEVQPETAAAAHSATPPSNDRAEDREGALQDALRARIKSVSLMSSLLQNLVQAGDVEGMIAACEQAVSLLLGIDKVLFFLTDKNNILLRGHTSSANSLQQTSQGLTLTLQHNSSLIVKTYHDMSMAYLTADGSTENLADRQILSVLRCNTVVLVPLDTKDTPVGVIALGLPRAMTILTASDYKLIQVVAQQVGICLQLERMKEQKKADLDAARKAAVSTTARKVAHEINNPLGIISNYIASMKLRFSDDEQLAGELTIIDEEIHRISSMIGQLDMFSQDPAYLFEATDVNAVINDIIQLVKSAHFVRSGMVISFMPDDALPQIQTSKDAIKQILINLLKNAAEAMNDGGRVTVTTRQPAGAPATGREGIEIVVTDTGPGLPETVAARLYTPFVTTKQSGHSGLGLSIVHKIVTDLGGALSCASSPADGTSFSIFLPSSAPDELRQSRMP
jgi:putative nucleotidyltransferase with HDIG domain